MLPCTTSVLFELDKTEQQSQYRKGLHLVSGPYLEKFVFCLTGPFDRTVGIPDGAGDHRAARTPPWRGGAVVRTIPSTRTHPTLEKDVATFPLKRDGRVLTGGDW